MADLLKELAEVLGIREVKKESPYVPKRGELTGGVPRMPKRKSGSIKPIPPFEPVPTIDWGDSLQATIDADERRLYHKDRFKPVSSPEQSDWNYLRRQK